MKQIVDKIYLIFSFERILAFFLLFFSITALIYRFYRFDFFTIFGALLSSLIIILILNHFSLYFELSSVDEARKISFSFFALSCLVLAITGTSIVLGALLLSGSSMAIITPWEVLPDWLFLVYFLTVIVIFYSLKTSALPMWLMALLSFAVIPFIYGLGYGYDFFIHEASMRQIMTLGEILPKTNFYLGQYSLLLACAKIFHVSYTFMHLWLVPIAAVIFLPWVIIKNNSSFSMRLAWLLTMILPYAFLTFTTPQNLGLLLLLIEIVLLSKPNKNNLLLSSFLVLFNLTIHPISAIPGLAILLLTILLQHKMTNRLILVMSTLLPITIPALLLATKAATWTGYKSLNSLFLMSPFNLPNSENIISNGVYTYYFNLPIIVILLLAVAYFANRKKIGLLIANVSLSLGLLGAVIMMQFIELQNVISYEQSDYAKRLLLISILIVLPVVVLLFSDFVKTIMMLQKKHQLIWFVFLAALLTASFYLSYPRHDKYFNSRGMSLSAGDIEAVKFIDQNSNNESYVVLANQQVSAASLGEFGFAHYYNNNFYYPVPTTNPLYRYYLDMVYKKPTRETALKAGEFAEVKKIYFVLNSYWLNFPKILEAAKLSADSYQSFANNSVYVFEYKKLTN